MECCEMKNRIEALEKDVERNASAHKEFYGRFEEIKSQNAVTEERYSNLLSLMTSVKSDVASLTAKPGKRWDAVVLAVISAIVGALIGALIGGAIP